MTHWTDRRTNPPEDWLLVGENHRIEDGWAVREVPLHNLFAWHIEFNTLEELVSFAHQEAIVLGTDDSTGEVCIEI